jgi:hypothetical protein
MLHREHLILILINTLAHGAEIAWQSSCCGTGRSFPRNWTDTSCWSTLSLPSVNDRAFFEVNMDCTVLLNTADSVHIGELYVANIEGKDMQLIGPVGGSKNNITIGIFTITSSSVLTIQDLNVVFSGSSFLDGKLNLTDCRATGLGSITISASPAQLTLVRSPPFTLDFHVPEVTVLYDGVLAIQASDLLSSSRIQNFGSMQVDVATLAELRGAVLWLRMFE